jgi:hypothetical protein
MHHMHTTGTIFQHSRLKDGLKEEEEEKKEENERVSKAFIEFAVLTEIYFFNSRQLLIVIFTLRAPRIINTTAVRQSKEKRGNDYSELQR